MTYPFHYVKDFTVSLFTREWIEMNIDMCRTIIVCDVSLFTREWIEIHIDNVVIQISKWSPSLRGSGLKCQIVCRPSLSYNQSPSLRGSGLKLLNEI